MNILKTMKAVGRFVAIGPTGHYRSGQAVTLLKAHTIMRKDLESPRTYVAMSNVTFTLTDDPEQFDNIPALTFVESGLTMIGPKPGETWLRKVQHSGDEKFNFACEARDDEDDVWFVWHRTLDGIAFVILKGDFFADRNNWEQI